MKTNNWEALNKKGCHFLNIDTNSLLQKIDELKGTVNTTEAGIIGIAESKLDHIIPDLKV